MIKNYLKVALRNFGRHKLFTFINVIGLSIGISAALVIYLIVSYDFDFDKFHPNGKSIYRVVTNYTFAGEPVYNSGVCAPIPDAIRAEVAGVAKVAAFFTMSDFSVKVPKQDGQPEKKLKHQNNIILTDDEYFTVFKYDWLAGSPKTALNAPYKVVLASDKAKKYFPGLSFNDMIGKTITYEDTLTMQVTGVVAPFKQNTDFVFKDFISVSTVKSAKALASSQGINLTNWGGTSSDSQCLVQLAPNTNPASVGKRLTAVFFKHSPPRPEDKGNKRWYTLQPLSDIHFNPIFSNFSGNRVANKNTLWGLLIIAAFLLILGCINFINLTTAQASQRAKEIGIRKTIGSTRGQLIIQLLSETFIITLVSVIISIGLAPIILKLFADFIPPDIKFDLLSQPGIILFLCGLVIVVSLLSGVYPALILSGYKPVQVLKSQSAMGNGKTRNVWLRKSLTVTQFGIAQFFIMATFLVSKQIHYAISKDLGFKKDAIVFVTTPWKNNNKSKKQVFADKLNAIPQIAMLSRGGQAPSSDGTSSTEATYKDGKKEVKTEVQIKNGDANYIKLYHIKLLAGRNIEMADSTHGFLINENYARLIGFKNPADAIGKTIQKFNGDKTMQIVGVISDFHQESLHAPVKPLVLITPNDQWTDATFHVSLKSQTPGGNEWKTAISAIEKAWKEIYPDDDFTYQFYDESIAKFYQAEQHTSQLLTWAAGLSIFISCLGLLGLAMYTTSLRTKEIGVRKVLGASVTQIVTLLSTEMVTLVLLAFVVVTPVAWWVMHNWIQNFSDRTNISWWIFAISGGGMLLTALLTLSSQTVRAALSNPVKSLRSE